MTITTNDAPSAFNLAEAPSASAFDSLGSPIPLIPIAIDPPDHEKYRLIPEYELASGSDPQVVWPSSPLHLDGMPIAFPIRNNAVQGA